MLQINPRLDWPAGQRQRVRVTPTLPVGRTLADWDSFALTVRGDPLWPRQGMDAARRGEADPIADGWPVVLSVAGVVSGNAVVFDFTVPTPAGDRRYAIDVWGIGGTAGDVQLVRATWLSVGASLL